MSWDQGEEQFKSLISLQILNLGMNIALVLLKTIYREGWRDQTLLSARFNGSRGLTVPWLRVAEEVTPSFALQDVTLQVSESSDLQVSEP